MALILFGLLLVSAFLFYHMYYKRLKFPPGPLPLPFVGNALQIRHEGPGEDAFLRWRREYGPVYTYWIGHNPVVCIADYQKMVDTFVREPDIYAGRYVLPFEHIFRGKELHGVISSSGDRWREQRRFALHVLRDFGLGMNLMQERILDELSAMFRKIDVHLLADKDEELNLAELIDVGIGSIINNLMFGYRFDGEKEAEFWTIKRMLDEHFRSFGSKIVLLWACYPDLLDKVPPFAGAGRQFRARLAKFMDFFKTRIAEHQRELDQHGQWEAPARDYVEAFLKEMKRRQEGEGQAKHYFDMFQCVNMCFDLWIAGQETTASTLAWGVAFLLNNEQSLQKMCAELDAQIGTDRLVTMADKQNLPYTNAVINEVLRVANLVPINLSHAVTEDVELDGYKLPKGTAVVPQVCALLIDDTIFPDPKSFNPERFLDKDGNPTRCDELIPFSLGKRQCLGESLARMELFLFLTNIFNQYKVSPGKVPPSLTRVRGAVVHCLPFTCRLEKRKAQIG